MVRSMITREGALSVATRPRTLDMRLHNSSDHGSKRAALRRGHSEAISDSTLKGSKK